MKKLVLLLFVALLFECVKENTSDSAIQKVKKLYDIGYPEPMSNGSILYNFKPLVKRNDSLIYVNPLIAAKKIKGCFDQGLGALPKKERLGKYSEFNNSIFDYYEWETLTDEVKMEQHLHRVTDTLGIFNYETDMYLECKIWITKK